MTALLEREADQLIPISAATLRQGARASFNIYVRAMPTDEPVLFCSADQEITAAQIGRMTKNDKLFIHRVDRDLYQGFLRENYEETIADEKVPVENRVSILSEVIRDVLGEQFANGSTQSILESCQQLGKNSATLLASEAVVPRELCSVLHHDFGTFTHSANVSAYAVVLGRALGFNASDLEQIAVGALLHDLGKLDIPEKILLIKDLSKCGVGLLTHFQVYPLETFCVELMGRKIRASAVRCRKLGTDCYEVGAVILY